MHFLTPLRALAKQLHKSPALWGNFCEIQRRFLSVPKDHGSNGDDTDEDYSRCNSSDESDGCLTDDVRTDSSDNKTKPKV